tara:strand:- start:553 stop:921 length:369 start_codon:yes stop_codon:yes gene_type:complete
MIKYLKTKTYMGTNQLNNKDISWEKTNNCENIINKYFNNMNIKKYENNNNNYYGEMFKILGYPAAIVIINNKYKKLFIEEFIINKNLMLMFDAAPLMRLSFYKKFKNINLKHAINKNIFMII